MSESAALSSYSRGSGDIQQVYHYYCFHYTVNTARRVATNCFSDIDGLCRWSVDRAVGDYWLLSKCQAEDLLSFQ